MIMQLKFITAKSIYIVQVFNLFKIAAMQLAKITF